MKDLTLKKIKIGKSIILRFSDEKKAMTAYAVMQEGKRTSLLIRMPSNEDSLMKDEHLKVLSGFANTIDFNLSMFIAAFQNAIDDIIAEQLNEK